MFLMATFEHNFFYLCPHCKGHLRLANEIVFLTKTNTGLSGLVLLNPKIGDYNVIVDPKLQYAPGEHVNFICPICYENLDAKERGANLAHVIRVDREGKESQVYFSKIVGEKCTYKVEDGKVESYGDDANNYKDLF
ncbi:MAG: hypothetical protein CVU05_07455 [Bacteroidetes bacterium HGW-Bacteroidetes-21]|nr:MAG: hypothetical protein CVU05_07455 [Bacteroidetes bacterium HGW-Bacteroidetes-21]